MSSFLVEAFKGLEAEWQAQPDLPSRLARVAKMSLILASEVLALLGLIPYALRCQLLYRRLPDLDKDASSVASSEFGVAIKKDVSYDQKDGLSDRKQRRVLDIYAPTNSHDELLPVVVFIHGGVWASGEKWHYAPLGVRLAQEGFIVVVPTYTLYPETLVPDMVKEVSDALSFVQDNIHKHRGDKDRIILAGHSAGAHLAAMVVVARIAASSILSSSLVCGITDSRMPSLMCLMAGVYHISRHYEFERARDVHELSMMKRAVGGFQGMDAMSPTVILSGQETIAKASTSEPSYFKSFDLYGEAIPHRSNLKGSPSPPSSEPPLITHPFTVVFSSLSDHMVPFHESQEYVSSLQARRVNVQHLIYNHTRHGDFATDWKPTRRGQVPSPLPPFASDLVKVMKRGDLKTRSHQNRSLTKPVMASMRFQGLSNVSKI